MHRAGALLLVLSSLTCVRADGPADNLPVNVRRIPPPGIKVPAEDREILEAELKVFEQSLQLLEKTKLEDFSPDVQIYYKAVLYALKYDEFFNIKEVAFAKKLLQTGQERLAQLRKGEHPWNSQTGPVVRAYRSKIDGSVQPYGLVVPKDYKPGDGKKYRLDFWCHGRSETLTELNFIQQRQSSLGEFASANTFVLHLYGRYCNASKLAGEVDCFEALEHVRKHYPIDENRLVMCGFSMGGAACWHFAVHYPSMWCAAAPGAGFSETPNFLKVFQNEDVSKAPSWEKKLWHMYDCTDYALNLFNLPTVAYSGEIDNQKQAADIMEKAMKAEGLELVHIIGPKTGHSYEKGAKAELIERIDKIAEKGRNPLPEKVKFVTYTLRYNRSFWITVEGLEQHWDRAQVEGEILDSKSIKLATKNIDVLFLAMPPTLNPFPLDKPVPIEIDGQKLEGPKPNGGKYPSWATRLRKGKEGWVVVDIDTHDRSFRKRPGLQGPIDDAFLDSFVMVRPTGKPLNEKTGQWCEMEMKHATAQWRQQFRGEAPIKDDTAITEDDFRNNLILWGDPSSNAVLKKIADKLPVQWKDGKVVVGAESYDAATHMPVLIYPNPLNPHKYVVLNSGFTYREYDYLNNARQVPKLPDYAVIDVSTPPNARYPGKVVTAGFFDDKWQLSEKK